MIQDVIANLMPIIHTLPGFFLLFGDIEHLIDEEIDPLILVGNHLDHLEGGPPQIIVGRGRILRFKEGVDVEEVGAPQEFRPRLRVPGNTLEQGEYVADPV